MGAYEFGVPELVIQHQPPNVVLGWHGVYDDVVLEARTNAPSTTGWAPVTNTPLAGEYDVVVDSATANRTFYRLRAP
jgi:hypothetical protein